eukprot:COSAG06_NODE_1369_length_9682_cov_25.340186_10_plen_56_part_00
MQHWYYYIKGATWQPKRKRKKRKRKTERRKELQSCFRNHFEKETAYRSQPQVIIN